ncbi:hypothetical protein I350_01656 [Cryptococcus amylolentus CBS 6273]|uniref:BRO domain-containing protein 1 n=1 Tax=Cryptococcus amylolentus CBS 6273 TaxID=1296118 RepID=A0A1E3KD86_9TREE|nr:hypothetical protein I350_01656 [Cryptococcus amylolentus CBS 6273]
MAFQSPLIAIPRKTTQDVDWTGPIRHVIAASYGEDPNAYQEECSVLQRVRQDAVRGAGSDFTGRDLLYKYFGQLELLELRFAEIKVSFAWNDAFTTKLTTQTSLAFEKASIIHLISAILSSIAQTCSRSDPEGLKRAYYNTRACAGMLTYINENFLHAPSTDLGREVVHLLIGIMMAQATEIFTEKLIEEKKSPALVSRSANQTASSYSAAVEEMKEFQGKGVFDRNWLYVLQIKSKLFASIAQYYKGTADNAAGKHGAALVRFRLADTLAQDAQRQSSSFNYTFVATATPSLPNDAGSNLHEIVKAHATVCKEAKEQATKDNDLIYNEVLPSEASLPAIEKLPPSPPITIQEVYANPEVTRLIGPDIFIKLVPLAVHESASVYSEEKAKLVRAEVERVELSEGEIRAALDHLGLPGEILKWRKIVEDDSPQGEVELSRELRQLVDTSGDARNVERELSRLSNERERCERELRELNSALDNESRECERMRAKHTPQFTQSPSGPQTSNLRSNISANLSALSSAAASDSQLSSLYQSVQPAIALLSSGQSQLESIASQVAKGKPQNAEDRGISLLDLQDEDEGQGGLSAEEKESLQRAIKEGTEKLERLGKIRKERDEVLKDLKEKIQTDDVSNLLLLNRRSSNVEPQLFASELEKFRPYQTRVAAASSAAKSLTQELEMLIAQVQRGRGVKDLSRKDKEKSKRVGQWEKGLIEAGESLAEIRAGLGKGLSYYESLARVIEDLKREVRGFVSSRDQERSRMVSEIEARQRLGGAASPSTSGTRGLEERLSSLSMGAPPPPSRPGASSATPTLPAPPSQSAPTPHYPPPPPPPKSNPYDFSSLGGSSAFSSAAAPSPPAQQQRQGSYGLYGYASPTSPSQGAQPQQATQPLQSPYPPPPSQPARPATQTYGSYTAPQAVYSAPPSQPGYTSPPPQQSYAPQGYGQSGYQPHPPSQPQAQGQGQYYPPPPTRPAYTSPPPQQPSYGGYAPPTSGYAFQAPSGYTQQPQGYAAPPQAQPQPQSQTQGQQHGYQAYGHSNSQPQQQQQQGGYPQYR